MTEPDWVLWATTLCQEVCALRKLQRHADESSSLNKRGPAYIYRLNTDVVCGKDIRFTQMMNDCKRAAENDSRLC